MKQILWTRNFTRITAATTLGAAGGIISQFALSFLVFDETGSTLASALVVAIQLIPMVLLAVIGGLLSFRKPAHSALYARDGLAVVALAWIFMSIFGGLPFYISGDIPRFVDCIFETVSGLPPPEPPS